MVQVSSERKPVVTVIFIVLPYSSHSCLKYRQVDASMLQTSIVEISLSSQSVSFEHSFDTNPNWSDSPKAPPCLTITSLILKLYEPLPSKQQIFYLQCKSVQHCMDVKAK